MTPFLKENLVTTKDASELSGYTSDYLARLARSGKIVGRRIGHTWLIDKNSLANFLEHQGDRKIDYARALARARGAEYRAHRSLLGRATKALTNQARVPQYVELAKRSLRSQAFALLAAFLVVASGALAAQAAFIPQIAERTGALARAAASGFEATFGTLARGVAKKIDTVNSDVRARPAQIAMANALASAGIATPLSVTLDLSAMPTPSHGDSSMRIATAFTRAKTDAPVLAVENLQSAVYALYKNLSSPSLAARTLTQAYVAIGQSAYDAIGVSLSAYRAIAEESGARTLALAATTRDLIGTAPALVNRMNLAFGAAIIDATHAAIRADVGLAYGTAAAAPAAARASVALIGGVGDRLARVAERLPALATAAYLRATSVPARAAPALAKAVFDAEYAVATRLVPAAFAVSEHYLALVQGVGTVAYVGTSGALAIADNLDGKVKLSQTLAEAQAMIGDASLAALGKAAVAVDSVKVRLTQNAQIAAVASVLSVSEELALATYETIHDFFSSTTRTLASLFFAPTPTIVMPTIAPKTVAIATSTPAASTPAITIPKPATIAAGPTYPTYVTNLNGVSVADVKQLLASERSTILATVAGMIQPVANQTVQNIQTIQMVNKIEDLTGLIVRNGDFRGGTFTGTVSGSPAISATSGSFSSLTADDLTSGTIVATGALTSYTSATAPYFVATSTTATSTFAGGLTVGTSKLVVDSTTGNVGIGTTTPQTKLSIVNTTNVSPWGDSGRALSLSGIEWAQLSFGDSLNNGGAKAFMGMKSSAITNASIWDLNRDPSSGVFGSTTMTHTRIAMDVADSNSSVTFWTASVNNTHATERMRIDKNGNVGIGSTTPNARLSVKGAGSTTGVNFQTTNSSDSPLFTILDSGNVGIGTTTPGYPLTVAGNGQLYGHMAIGSGSVPDTVKFVLNESAETPSILMVNERNSGYGIISAMLLDKVIPGENVVPGLFTAETPASNIYGVNYMTGVSIDVDHYGAGTADWIAGVRSSVYSDTANTVNTLTGLTAESTLNYVGGTVTRLSALSAESWGNMGAGTVTSAYGLQIRNLRNTSGTIANTYGIHLGDLSTGTQTNAPYALYSSDVNAKSYFAGNVGIGTTSPSSALAVSGDFFLTGSTTITGAGAGLTFTGTGNHDITAAAGTLRIGSNTIIGNIEALDDTVDIGTPVTRFDKIYANEVNATTLVGTLTGGNLTPETVTINSDNATADTENSYLVFERGSISPSASLSWNSALSAKRFELNHPLFIQDASASTTNTTLTLQSVAGQTGDVFRISSSSSATNFFTVTGAGNVGIGTASPQTKLDVLGTASSTNLVITTAGTLDLQSGNGNISISGAGTTEMDFMVGGSRLYSFQSGYNAFVLGSAQRVSWSSNTDPAAVGPDTALYRNAAGVVEINNGTNGQLRDITLRSASTTGQTVLATGGGNVGIGTTTPQSILHLYQTGGPIITLQRAGSATPTGQIFFNGELPGSGVVYGSLIKGYNGEIQFYNDATPNDVNNNLTQAVTITSTGNVGIGTTSPWAQLSVNPNGIAGPAFVVGSSTATKFMVTNSGQVLIGTTTTSLGSVVTALLVDGGPISVGAVPVGSDLGSGGMMLSGHLVSKGVSPTRSQQAVIFSGSTGTRIGAFSSQWLTTNLPVELGNGSSVFLGIDSTGNVGIGTTSPISILAIQGSTPTLTIKGTGTASAQVDLQGSDGNWRLENQYINGAETNVFRIFNTGLNSNAITILRNSNNVGIGTTTPIAKLDIYSASGATPAITAGAAGNNYSLIKLSGPNSSHYLQSAFSGSSPAIDNALILGANGYYDGSWHNTDGNRGSWAVIVNTGGTGEFSINRAPSLGSLGTPVFSSLFTVLPSGNVGIGTTTPSTNLQIYDPTLNSKDVLSLKSVADNVDDYLGMTFTTGVGGDGPHAAIRAINGPAATDARLGFYTTTNGGTSLTEKLSIDHVGNVGIGTTTPMSALSVNGNIQVSSGKTIGAGVIAETDTSTYTKFGFNELFDADDRFSGMKVSSVVNGAGYSGGQIGFFTTNAQISLAQEVMRITNTGNVGLGTTSPGYKLGVAGSLGITDILTNTRGSSVWQQYGSGADYYFGSNSSGNLKFADNSGVGGISVGSSYNSATIPSGGAIIQGNVGIGTTTPGRLLHVYAGASGKVSQTDAQLVVENSSAATINVLAPNNTYTGIYFGNVDSSSRGGVLYTGSAYVGTLPADSLSFTTAGVAKMVITSTGNVGIGTTSPINYDNSGDNLVIYETGGEGGITVATDNNQKGALLFADGTSGDQAYRGVVQYDHASDYMRFYTAGAEKVRITNTGNVGIGTTSPSQALSVQGNGLFSGNISAANITATGTVFAGAVTGFTDLPLNPGTGNTKLLSAGGGTLLWYTGAVTSFNPGSDNTYDLGTSALRVRTGYFGTSLKVGTGATPETVISSIGNSYFGGNVGIGTTDPGATLDVVGSINVRTGVGGTLLLTSGANGGQVGYVGGTNFYLTNAGMIPVSTNVYALGGSANYWAHSYIKGITVEAGDTLTSSGTQSIILADASDGGMYIRSNYAGVESGGIKFQVGGNGTKVFIDKTGNVGIGTTNPDHLLTIAASQTETNPGTNGANGLRFTNTSLGSGAVLGGMEFYQWQGTRVAGIYATRDAADIVGGIGGNLVFATKNAGAIGERMRIDYNGNVGIGTTTPTTLLDVAGPSPTLLVEGTQSAGSGSSRVRIKAATSGAPDFSIVSDTGTFIGGYFSFRNNITGIIPLTINNVDFVGIGSSVSAASQLSVGGNVSIGSYAATAAPANGLIVSGNVGIGTTTPTVSLVVSKEAGGGSAYLRVSSADNAIYASLGATSGKIRLYSRYMAGDTAAAFSITQGATDVFNIDTSGNVGIGTTNPLSALNVAGTTGITWTNNGNSSGLVTIGSGSTNGVNGSSLWVNTPSVNASFNSGLGITGTYGTPSQRSVININAYGVNSGTGYGSDMAFSTTKDTVLTERMRIDMNGNVGIGTTSPQRLLHLYGSGAEQILQDTSQAADSQAWSLQTFEGNLNFRTVNDMVTAETGVGKVLSLTRAGNVGIGTTSPWGKLSITGSGTGTGLGFVFADSGNSPKVVIQDNGNVGIGTTSPYAKLSVAGNAVFDGTITASGFTATSSISAPYFTATSASATSTFAGGITGPNNFIVQQTSGNVGIGTASPQGGLKLDVNGNASFGTALGSRVTISRDDGVTPNYLSWYNSSNQRLGYLGGASATNLHLGLENSANLEIIGGNVGIGTTTPNEQLNLTGNQRFTSTGSVIYSLPVSGFTTTLDLAAGNSFYGSNGSSIRLQSSGGAADGTILFNTTQGGVSSAERMRITNTGNVGIGTTSPGYTLGVTGSLGITGIQYNTRGSSVWSQYGSGTEYYMSAGGSELFRFSNNSGVGGVSIGSSYVGTAPPSGGAIIQGNVGIGTTTPGTKLTISSSAVQDGITIDVAANPQIVFQRSGVAKGYLAVTQSAGNYGPTLADSLVLRAENNLHLLSGGGTGNMVITSGGNVGIGTTTPYSKLSVWGANTTAGVNMFELTNSASTTLASMDNAGNFSLPVATATTTIGGGLNVNSGGLVYDLSSGATTIANLNLGATTFDTDAGMVQWIDMPVTSASVAGTIESYTASLNSNPLLTIYGLADGLGGMTNLGVGIGTTSPQSTLAIQNSYGTRNNYLFSISSSTAADGSTATDFFNVTNAGYVGIGTTTPTGVLHISGKDNQTQPALVLQQTFTRNPMLQWFAEGGSGQWTAGVDRQGLAGGVSNNFYISNSSVLETNTRFTISTAGNVGIGTTSPWGQLSVNPNGITGPAFVVGSSTATNFIVTNGGNVGIGTASPAYKLAVNGTTLLGGDVNTANGTWSLTNTSGNINITSGGGGQLQLQGGTVLANPGIQIGAADTGIYRLAANKIAIGNGTAGDYTGTLIAGNVGIGTTSPINYDNSGDNLVIYETGGEGGITVATDNNQKGALLFADGTSGDQAYRGVVQYDHASDYMRFYTAGAEKVRITNTGNVGIGTTTPGTKLDVIDDSADAGIRIRHSNLTSGISIGYNTIKSNGTSADQNINITPAGTGSVLLTSNLNFLTAGATGNVYVYGNSVNGEYGNNANGLLHLNYNGYQNSTSQFRDTQISNGKQGSIAFFQGSTGNVGIGTTTPWGKLSVTGSGTGTGLGFVFADSGNSPKMVIQDNGNVGIGTTSPANKLHVYGTSDTYIQVDTTAASQVGISWKKDNAHKWLAYVPGSSNDLRFWDGTADRVTFQNGGNVGIGTTTPDSVGYGGRQLTIHGTGTNNGLTISGTAADLNTVGVFGFLNSGTRIAQIEIQRNGTVSQAAFSVKLNSGLNEVFRINTTGNVGIGTTTPDQSLSIGGANANIHLVSTANGGNKLMIGNGAFTTGQYAIYTETASDLQFGTNSTANMIIKSGGNVGIGTTSPASKLAVSGGASIGANYNIAAPTNGLIVEGNVGIGTSSPVSNARLEISNISTNYAIKVTGLPGASNRILQVVRDTGTAGWSIVSAGGGQEYFNINDTSGNTKVSFDTLNDLSYFIGKHGVGTTTPWGQLSASSTSAYPTLAIDQHGAGSAAVFLGGNVGIGTTSPAYKLDVAGFINTDQYSGYKQAGNLLAYASSTNFATIFGLDAGGQNATTSATAVYTTAIGYQALNALTTGIGNTAIGYQALKVLTTGANNTAIGRLVMSNGTVTGSGNTSIGAAASQSLTSGSYNTVLGYQPLLSATTGSYNIAIGYQALNNVTSGTDNIMLGRVQNTNGSNITTGSNNILIGYNAGLGRSTSESNFLNIGNSFFGIMNATSSAASLPTDFAAVRFGIGTSSPWAMLSINPTAGLTGPAFVIGSSTATNFIVTNGGNVGVGTTSPSAALSVHGTTLLNNNLTMSAGQILASSGSASAPGYGFSSSVNSGFYLQSGGDMQFVRAGATKFTIQANYANFDSSVQLVAKPGTASSPSYSFNAGSVNTGIFGDVSHIGFSVTGSEKMRIDSSGNVGVGTTTPWGKLSVDLGTGSTPAFVVGDSTSPDNTPFIIDANGRVGIGLTNPSDILEVATDSNGNNGPRFRNANAGSSAATEALWGNDTGWAIGGVRQNSSSNTSYGGANSFNIGTYGSTNLSFFTNSTAAMTIDAAREVGIGTTDPVALLSLNAGTSGYGYTKGLLISYNGADTSGGLSLWHDDSGQTSENIDSRYDSATAAMNFRMRVKGTPVNAMTILGSGNVGIGTTTPDAKLNVNGTLITDGAMYSRNTVGNFFAGASGGDANYGFMLRSAANTWALGYGGTLGTLGTPVLNWNSSGNVGIGTTSPGAKLDVLSDSSAAAAGATGLVRFVTSNNADSNLMYLEQQRYNKDVLTLRQIQTSSSGYLIKATSADGANFVVGANGNVGIGDTTPDALLDVKGTVCLDLNADEACTDNTAAISDARLKTNVVTLTDSLGFVNQMRPVRFAWNGTYNVGTSSSLGFIAQEVETIFPELVITDTAGYKNLDYSKLTAVLAGATQELDSRTRWMESATTSTVLSVDVAGRIGIGTSTPSHTLEVIGDIAAIAFVNTSTKTAKKDITYASASSTDDMLDQLVALKVATYRYTLEDQSNPLRLGLISEDTQTIAPEILSADGKGVDIYKLATFNLAATQALAARFSAIETRVASLEERLAALESGAISSASGTISLSSSTLANVLEGFGVLIQKGIAQFNTLVFRQLVASKDADGTSSAGSVSILAGNTVAQVNNSLVMPSTKVFITFNSQITGSWWVSDKAAGSFRVILSSPQVTDVSFDYFLVQTEGQIATSTPNGAPGVSQSSGPDIVAPAITLLGDNPLRLAVGGTFVEPGVTVTDNADASVPVAIYVDGVEQPADSSTITTSSETTHIITYRATDAAGNATTALRSVIVGNPDGSTSTPPAPPAPTDTTAPVVTLTGAAALELAVGDTFTDPGATALDDTDGDLTASVVVTGAVDTATEGLYTLTYTATDAAGNAGSVSRLVTVLASISSPQVAATSTEPI